MKIAITGSNGYIGRHVVSQAIQYGHSVVAIDLNFPKIPITGAEYIELDLLNSTKTVNPYRDFGKPDVLIHLAWKDGFIHNSENHMKDLSAHINFLNSYINCGGKNISVMGTMHEVGYFQGAINSKTPCNPLSQYGIAKNALRQSLLLTQKQNVGKENLFNLFWLRAFYIFGDDAQGSSIFSKLVTASNAGKKVFPFTTGKNKYDFISVKELAKQIVLASTQAQKEVIQGIINVCSGKPISLANQVEQYIKDNKLDIKLEYGAFPDREYDSPEVYGDATKIKKIINCSKV